LIQALGLTKIFKDRKKGEIIAADDLTFECLDGEIFGLLGPNGAGKTTTLRMLSTMMLPTKGTALVNGFDIIKQPNRVRREIGFLSSETGLYDRFTPTETVRFFGKLNGMRDGDIEMRMEEIFEKLDMKDYQDQRVEKLSTGMKQKLSIARSIIHDPRVMVFDEPTVGLDIIIARVVTVYIKLFRDEGKCIIFSTHIMREAEKLCDKIAIIDKGKIIAQGTLEELKSRTGKDDLEEVFFTLVELEDKDLKISVGRRV
jgi:sodium transport system ATP-binding protein